MEEGEGEEEEEAERLMVEEEEEEEEEDAEGEEVEVEVHTILRTKPLFHQSINVKLLSARSPGHPVKVGEWIWRSLGMMKRRANSCHSP